MQDQIERVVPLYRRAGVRLVLSGHEHNFQHGRRDGIDYVVSGAGGKLETEPPCWWDEAGTLAWAAEPHCLLVEVDEERITVTPYGVAGPDEAPCPLELHDRDGRVVEGPVVISRREASPSQPPPKSAR
jgi:hypothetical protein